jgi:DNA invertase Pin-like site-specific DNA recombinase
MFQMLGVFAEFERGMIRERVNVGLARAKAKGTKLGRRPVKPAVETRIRELKAEGMGILKIGRTVGVGTSVAIIDAGIARWIAQGDIGAIVRALPASLWS